jgi:hypothetical protein
MTDATADKAKMTVPERKDDRSRASEMTALDRRYGEIGISAVAAAARYQGGAKNPAYAPAPARWYDRTDEAV